MTKRILDVLLAVFGLVVFAPVLAAIAILVRIRDGPPVIYKAIRVGLYGRLFMLLKFRTMVPSNRVAPGSSVTVWADPRVTPLGQVLRKHKLDELPQLLNVLRGDMSFVGPRPEDPEYVALYTTEQRRVLSVRPGITGAATLQYANEEELLKGENWEQMYRMRIMPAKLALELDYLARRSLITDVGMLMATILKLAGRVRSGR